MNKSMIKLARKYKEKIDKISHSLYAI